MFRFMTSMIQLLILAIVLSSCATGSGKPGGSELSTYNGDILDSGSCVASRKWGEIYFDAELQRIADDKLSVKVDMSRTPWDVGVIDAWFESDDRKIMPLSSSEGALTEHESDNLPAASAAAGVFLDEVRNNNIGTTSRIATVTGGAVGMVIAETRAQKRREQFDPKTTRWSGQFQAEMPVSCQTVLKVRYWLPAEGVKGRRGIKVGHCFCE